MGMGVGVDVGVFNTSIFVWLSPVYAYNYLWCKIHIQFYGVV